MKFRPKPAASWPKYIVPASVGAAVAVGLLIANAALNFGPCGPPSDSMIDVCLRVATHAFPVGGLGAFVIVLGFAALLGAAAGVAIRRVFRRKAGNR